MRWRRTILHAAVLQQPDARPSVGDACPRAAAKFVAANAGPGNLMAVAEYGNSLTITQNFTADTQRLQQVVSGAQLAGSMTDKIGVPGDTAASSAIGNITFSARRTAPPANCAVSPSPAGYAVGGTAVVPPRSGRPDLKSTRLNSSHRCISYAVF